MKAHWIEEPTSYDGSQLRAHWIRRTTGVIGDAVVAFRGPCDVSAVEMADLVDLLDGPGIAGDDMVHFVCEVFDDGDLGRAVLRQRLQAGTALEVLRGMAPDANYRREGDDLYVDDRKLSISIATRSLVSTLIHFAVNVVTSGTPIPTAGLGELGVDPREFAERLLGAMEQEERSMTEARCQVRAKDEYGG